MEDTLGGVNSLTENAKEAVLILVLMEDTLGDYIYVHEFEYVGLNPCFNGRYSRRAKTYISLFIAV